MSRWCKEQKALNVGISNSFDMFDRPRKIALIIGNSLYVPLKKEPRFLEVFGSIVFWNIVFKFGIWLCNMKMFTLSLLRCISREGIALCLKCIIRIFLFHVWLSLVTSYLFCPDLNKINLVIRCSTTCWDQSFSKLVILPDYALRISLGTFSILHYTGRVHFCLFNLEL